MEGQHRPDRNWSILSFASRGANDISRLGGPGCTPRMRRPLFALVGRNGTGNTRIEIY
jgi:hypothetical protein